MNYKISTIMPVYNSEKYIRQAIESLINQTYKNIEIIIIDDGSTDNSSNIIKQYAEKDSRIKWFHQKNKGGSKSLNFGISKATGDLIHFLDSDDYMDIKAYEIIINEFENDPKIKCCMFSYYMINENGEITNTRRLVDKKIKTNLYENPNVLIRYDSAQWMKVVKKEIIKENNIVFDNTYFGYDVLFHLNIIKNTNSVMILPNNFVYYRTSNQNSSSGDLTRSKYYKIHFKCFKHCVALYKKQSENIRKINLIQQFDILIWYLNRSINKYKDRNKRKLIKFIRTINDNDKNLLLEDNESALKYEALFNKS